MVLHEMDQESYLASTMAIDHQPMSIAKGITVVPALGDPRRERPSAVYGHFVNVPIRVNVKFPQISGHLPNVVVQGVMCLAHAPSPARPSLRRAATCHVRTLLHRPMGVRS